MVARKGEEAIRARDLALQKLATRDFRSARKLAARAHRLSPDLDGLGQIILVCDVHCSDPKIPFREDERDWYKILGVGPTAYEAAVKRQYNRMALGLHPDKNRLPGATEAFSLVGRAKAILADSEKRRAFDGRRKARALEKSRNKVAISGFRSRNNPCSSEKPGNNMVSGFQGHRVDNNGGVVEKSRNNLNFFQENNPGSLEKSNNILGFSGCQNENPGPMDNPRNNIGFSGFQNDNPGSQEKSRNDFLEKPMNNIGFSAFKNDNIGFGKFRESGFLRFNDSGLAGLHIQPGPSPDQGPVSRTITKEKLVENITKPTGFADVQGKNLKFGPKSKENIKKPKGQTKTKKTEKEGDKNGPRVDMSVNCDKNLHFPGQLAPMLPPDFKSLEYSDSELNDFGKERAKRHFGQGQIWAVYDTLDAMPRFYALINKVISDDFQVEITWLEPLPNNETEKKWLHKGLPASCGKFRPGKSEIIEDHAAFSHLVKWKKDIRHIYHVYPRKGETWAVFKNWKMDWHLDPRRHLTGYGFDFVEIISDYRAGIGVKVAFLGKVNGFSTFFGRMGDGQVVVPVSDRYRFSHRVLSFQMTSDVGPDGDSRTFELDPASLPEGFGVLDS